MKLTVDNHFQKRVMIQSFDEPVQFDSKNAVLAWRKAWMEELKSWHSPYKVVVDCSNIQVRGFDEVKKELSLALRFFEGLFLKKIVGFGYNSTCGHDDLPFQVFASEKEALEHVGLKEGSGPKVPKDFRANIQIQNHFSQHVMELSFHEPTKLATKEQLDVLKSKITNNLMQWHSKWNLLIDCAHLDWDPEIDSHFLQMIRFFKGFFLKEVLGYAPLSPKELYPFQVYRARHNAAGRLESEGKVAGDSAVCRSNKLEKA